jgi:hypothetical protein
MTKLCPRGKSAAKRKFAVYPSAYANAYASKICAGKIKDPSGTKRKDWGPKKAKEGGDIMVPKKKPKPKKQDKPKGYIISDQRGMQMHYEPKPRYKNGGGADMGKVETEKKTKKMYGDRNRRRRQLQDIQNPKSEYDEKGKLIYTAASQGKIMQVANKLEKASKAHAGQAKTLKSLKLSRGGGIAIKGTDFKGVF